MIKKTAIVAICLLIILQTIQPVMADELDDIRREIEQRQAQRDQAQRDLEAARAQEGTLSGQLSYMQTDLGSMQTTLAQNEEIIASLEQRIQEQKDEKTRQENLWKLGAKALYMQSRISDTLAIFSNLSFSDVTRLFVYRSDAIQKNRDRILTAKEQLAELDEQKTKLSALIAELQNEQQAVRGQIGSLQNQISNVQSQQQSLAGSLGNIDNAIQSLSQKEQEVLAAKAAAAASSTSVGNNEASWSAIDAPAPDNENVFYSFWTYGYPHRVGMGQYGAYAQAQQGKSYADILKFYYQDIAIVSGDLPAKIKVDFNGQVISVPFEDYIKGIAEMPSSWGTNGLEALKAQAVAARTYAARWIQANGTGAAICSTQACQVYIGDAKVNSAYGELWAQAVEETEGKIITQGGNPISAWYSSTNGGYTLTSAEVWTSATSYTKSIADPYDEISPWHHKAWGNTPWLSAAQTTDLLNAAQLPENYHDQLIQSEKGGLSPKDVEKALKNEGIAPIKDLKSIEVFMESTKKTTTLRVFHGTLSTDIDAAQFRFIFNIRSPGTDAIWTSKFDVARSK